MWAAADAARARATRMRMVRCCFYTASKEPEAAVLHRPVPAAMAMPPGRERRTLAPYAVQPRQEAQGTGRRQDLYEVPRSAPTSRHGRKTPRPTSVGGRSGAPRRRRQEAQRLGQPRSAFVAERAREDSWFRESQEA